MKEKTKEGLHMIAYFFVILLLIVVVGSVMFYSFQRDYKTVRGTLTDVRVVYKDNGDIKFYDFFFDNDTKVRAIPKYGQGTTYYDFTKGSELIVEFSRYKYARGSGSRGEYWDIDSVIKIPE